MNPLIHEIFQKYRLLNKQLNHSLKEHQLFASQWTVIFCVYQHGEMTLTDIWKYLNVEAPTITRTVSRLQELGWLEIVSGKDRRAKNVRLSQKAFDQLPEIIVSITQFEHEAMKNLTDEEQAFLMKLLNKINIEGSM